jgi:hypothetical protein
MPIAQNIHDVFGHFQNLNLLALLENLRQGRAVQHAWARGARLCPVAHGLPAGEQVRHLTVLGQMAALEEGCDYVARHLGAEPRAVGRFVTAWDEQDLSLDSLVRQLEAIWHERRADADAVQEVLHGADRRNAVC